MVSGAATKPTGASKERTARSVISAHGDRAVPDPDLQVEIFHRLARDGNADFRNPDIFHVDRPQKERSTQTRLASFGRSCPKMQGPGAGSTERFR